MSTAYGVKRLFLLRHAKSSWDEPELADRERPLAERGERDAPAIAARLREHLEPPACIVTSPAARAMRTATLVAAALGMPADRIAVTPELYLAAPADYLRAAARSGGDCGSLMVVGHNPGLTELVHRLLPDFALGHLPTAGLVVVDFAADAWTRIERAPPRLVYYDYPKNPKAPLLG
jgi:phosphohistidine phosphatase